MSAIHLRLGQPRSGMASQALQRRHAGLDALGDATHWALGKLAEWRRRSRERAELASLDERTLRDIGLTRSDAEFLSNKPFWRG